MTDIPLGTAENAPHDEVEVRSSVLGDLRAARAKIGANAAPLTLDFPGYDGKLVLRFKWVSAKVLGRTAPQIARMKDPIAQREAASADLIAATCSAILVREGDKLVSLAPDDTEVSFKDPHIAVALGFPQPSTVRETIIQAFGNEYALSETADRVSAWLEDTTQNVNREFLGE